MSKYEPYLHHGVLDAIKFAMNNDYQQAEIILLPNQRVSPRFALEVVDVRVLRSLVSGLVATEELIKDYDTVEKLAEKCRSQQLPIDTEAQSALSHEDLHALQNRLRLIWKVECDVVHAEALLMRCSLQINMAHYIKGGVNMRLCWGRYKDLLARLTPGAPPLPKELELAIKFGAGMFYAWLSLVPAKYMTLLELIGFAANREKGLAFLTEVVYAGNEIRAPYAALILCCYYLFFPTALAKPEVAQADAKAILDFIIPQYPKNSHFYAFLNLYHRKRGETEEAISAIAKAVENATVPPLLFEYVLADTLYMDLQFETALDKYNAILPKITSRDGFDYPGQMLLSIAACREWLGDTDGAFEIIKTIPSRYNPNSKHDAHAPKWAAHLLDNPALLPLLGVYVLYMNRDLSHMRREKVQQLAIAMEEAVSKEPASLSTPEGMSMYMLFRGVLAQDKGDIIKAAQGAPHDSIVRPYALYEWGAMEFSEGDVKKAHAHFLMAQKCKEKGHDALVHRLSLAVAQTTH
jgi:tetratricopeptide (TPR) repeat protein